MSRRKVYPFGLIGKKITVSDARNTSLVGMSGKVIWESKNTVRIETAHAVKTLLKKNITLKIEGVSHEVKGSDLMRRPEDRIKGK